MSFLRRFLPIIVFGALFIAVIYFTQPPKSWFDAQISQILIFFLPLLALFTSIANFYTDNLIKSFTIALGGMVLVVLKSIDQLNPVTLILTVVATFLLSSSFKNMRLTTIRRRHKLTR